MMIRTWGANSHGQLGLGTKNEQIEKPTKVAVEFYNNKVAQISCGGGHSLLLDTEGRLFACGWNSKLQLAVENEVNTFQRVWPLSGIKFTNVASGWDFSCGVTDDQFLFVWGSNSHGQLGLPKPHFNESVKPIRLQVNACAISMGLRHTAIINSKGEVWVTGCGRHGQLGLGKEILDSDRFQVVPKLGKVSHVACGQKHTVAWSSEENALFVWGDNSHGQLLLSSEKYRKIFIPQKIDIGVKCSVRKLLSGWTHVLLWLENGDITTWGRNNFGQLGTEKLTGEKTNIQLPGNKQIKDIAVGSEHTICLATDNTLWAWGWNEHCNTGIESAENIFEPTLVPVELAPGSIITNIFAGGAHNFVIAEDTNIQENGDISIPLNQCAGKDS